MTLRPILGLALLLVACGGNASGSSAPDGGAGFAATGGVGAGGSGGVGLGGSGGGLGGSGGLPSGGTGGGACADVQATMSADFLLVISATFQPKSPILFHVTGSTAPSQMLWTLQALDAKDRTTPVGSPIVLPPIDVGSDGTFAADLPPMDIVGAANAITGSDITVAIQSFTGSVCVGGNFYCGDLDGAVTKPITLPLAGSTWTLTRMNAAQGPVVINCAQEPADPPPP